jgi:hypothetical protein
LVDQFIPQVPVRQWVLSFPIALRIPFAAQPELLASVLRIIHRVIASFLIKQAGLKRRAADTGAVTLIQRFGSAANLNIHRDDPRFCLSLQMPRRSCPAVFVRSSLKYRNSAIRHSLPFLGCPIIISPGSCISASPKRRS